MDLKAALARLDRLTATYDDPTAREAFETVRDALAGSQVPYDNLLRDWGKDRDEIQRLRGVLASK